MRSHARFLAFLLVLLLLMPAVQAESYLEMLNSMKGHELEYIQRFSGHAVANGEERSVLEVHTGIWSPNGEPDKKGAALGAYVAMWERDLIRQYNLHFADDGTLDSFLVADYIDSSPYNGDYAPVETLQLTNDAERQEAANKGLAAYLDQLFAGAADEWVAVETEGVYTEPFYMVENGEMLTIKAGRVMFSITLKKDCDWAKAGQVYGVVWNLAYNELTSMWRQQ